ncbi:MAG: SpoIIE family protein phosphatase [Verrucomicrobia bacterium]|nr:SpoIIE family protein phosphatase [Verrucomicrobiota bacterium]
MNALFQRGRLPLRSKMLILLVGITLAPLALVVFLDFRATLHLGESLAGRTREALTRAEGQRLRLWVDEKAAWLQSRRRLIEQTLRSQAREVERCLVLAPSSASRVFFSEDFRREPFPPGTVPSSKHFLWNDTISERKLIAVTYRTQVFALAPGLTRKAVAIEIQRLAAMNDAYRFLQRNDPDLIYWQYTGLESGLLSSYPGDGNTPEGYDPRQRDWYRAARENRKLTWVGPYIDANSRQLILTVSMPVHRSDGSLAGVTALDMTVNDLARNLQMSGGSPSDAVAMVVTPEEGADAIGLKVYARPGYARPNAEWNAPFDVARITSSDALKMRRVIATMRDGKSGTELMAFEGQPSLWAYGPLDDTALFLAAIIPNKEVIAEALAAQQDALFQTSEQLRRVETVFAAMILVVILLAFLSSRAISRPIQELAAAARRVAEGAFDARVDIHTRDEIEDLGAVFNRMVPQLHERIRIKQSLDLAREVQQQLLPAHVPQIQGLDVAGKSVYCDETGGDYYDYFQLARNGSSQLGVALGDITGHGVASAMLMATARSLLRAHIEESHSLDELLQEVNHHLAADVSGGRFMTLYYLLINPRQRVARWVSAGHDPAIRYNPDADVFDELGGGDPPLAIDPAQLYHEQGPVNLHSGDVIILGTDGVWEARAPNGQRFGKDALREVIRAHARAPASGICDAIAAAIAGFRQTRPQEDDITLVAVKILACA